MVSRSKAAPTAAEPILLDTRPLPEAPQDWPAERHYTEWQEANQQYSVFG